MDKLLVQSRASEKDKAFSSINVIFGNAEVDFLDYFHKNRIKTLKEDLIISCHGNLKLDMELTDKIDKLSKKNKVVSVQAGGLYFAKPSLEATLMPTVPVISIPNNGGYFGGADALLAPNVPSGVAVVAGVAIDDYQTAATVAKEILSNNFEGVHVYGNSEKLIKNLEKSISESLENLRLKLHSQHCYVYPATIGRHFLGQKIFRTHRRLNSYNVRKFKRRLKYWLLNPPDNLTQKLESWKGHASQANCHLLLKSLELI